MPSTGWLFVFCFIAVPVEWLTLSFNMPWMLLLGDIRQGLFYAMLLSFWVIFTGEHMMVRTKIYSTS